MQLFILLALSGYVTASAGYVGYPITSREVFHRMGHGFFVLGVVCHTVYLMQIFAILKYLPVDNLASTINFAAWALALVYAVFHVRYKLKILGACVGPVVASAVILSLSLPAQGYAHPETLKSVWMVFHILAVFAGNGAFILAALVGGIYLIQERSIKQKNHGFLFRRLPSLELLDRMGYACVAFGFPLLTLGLATGFIYAQAIWGRWWSWDPKEVWSVATWLFYAALLHERLAVGWRGRRAAIMALVGLLVLLFTFLGVNLLLPGHHGQFTKW